MRVVRMALPDGEQQVMCQRLTVASLAALGQLDALGDDVGASVGWFGAAYSVAMRTVTAGRILPRLDDTGLGWWIARWRPLRADLATPIAELAAAMPPVVRVASPAFTPQELTSVIIDSFVDQTARLLLAGAGWHAPVTDTRRLSARATRAAAKALSAPTGEFRVDADLGEALDDLATMLDQAGHRAEGEPVVRARLRLGLPDDPLGDWALALELVDPEDRSKWCTADDVNAGSAAALSLAGDERFLPILAECLATAAVDLEILAPWLAEWLADQRRRHRPRRRGGHARSGRRTGDCRHRAAHTAAPDAPHRNDARGGAAQERIGQCPLRRRGHRRLDSGGRRHSRRRGHLATCRRLRRGAHQRQRPLGPHRPHGGSTSAGQPRRAPQRAHRAVDARAAAACGRVGCCRAGSDADGDAEGDGDSVSPPIVAAGWLGDLLQGLPDAALGEGIEPPGFMATLRPYQRRGLGWLQFLHQLGLGGCLADDMGLGKTPTTLAHLAALPGPHLVICPLSVVRNWEAEAARFTPLMRVAVHHGTGRSDASTFADVVAQHDLVITTYHVAARDIATINAVQWTTVVFDEAQAVKNPETRTAKALRTLPAAQHIALTGTPVENRLSELWSIMSMVTPGLLGNLTSFRRRFATPIERNHDDAAAEALRRLTSPFLLRRTKADKSLVPDLPDKVEQLAWASLTREQAGLYQGVVDQLLADAQQTTGMRRRGLVLAALTRLKQICNHPAHALGDGSRLGGRSGKLTRFDELVADLLDAEEQALVFTQFREMGLLLQRHLNERFALPTPFLHGGVPRKGRDRMVDDFQSRFRITAAAGVAAGRWHRFEPHRRVARRPLRPMVEPRGGGSSDRSGVAHRPAALGVRAQARVPGHHRGTRRRDDQRQASSGQRRGRLDGRGMAQRAVDRRTARSHRARPFTRCAAHEHRHHPRSRSPPRRARTGGSVGGIVAVGHRRRACRPTALPPRQDLPRRQCDLTDSNCPRACCWQRLPATGPTPTTSRSPSRRWLGPTISAKCPSDPMWPG